MNKILNPFDYLSIRKAWGWGVAGTVLAIVLLVAAHWPVGCDLKTLVSIFSTNLMLWLPLSALLYLAALVFSPSRIRAVDIFATNLFALLPTTLAVGLLTLISTQLGRIPAEPLSVVGVLLTAARNLTVIILSVAMVWSMVWGCFAYYVSANLKGGRGITIFVVCYTFVSVVVLSLEQYL